MSTILQLPRTRLSSIRNRRFFSSAPPPGSTNIKPRNAFRTIRNASLAAGLGLATYTAGALFPPQSLTFIAPRPAPAPPSDINSPASIKYTSNLESQLQSLPLLVSLRSQPDADEWYETRPYRDVSEERRVNNLTAGALRGPGKLAFAPLVRARKDESESVIIVHVGRGLCGHDGIVHGGLLATLLDEGLGRTAIKSLPDQVGVTAYLSIDYRAPTKADQFIVIKTRLTEVKGRKAWVEGHIEDTNGNVLAEAKTMFVQPKYAKLLNTKALRQAMGEPEPRKDSEPVHLAKGTSVPPLAT